MAAPKPSTGEKQTIQARHGVATFVPKGHTIKIINTYGRQVVDTWAFALHAPPEDSDIHKGEKEPEKSKEAEKSRSKSKSPEKKTPKTPEKQDAKKAQDSGKEASSAAKKTTGKAEDVGEGASSGAKETTEKAADTAKDGTDTAEKGAERLSENDTSTPKKKTWSSYIPTVRGRGKATAKEEPKAETGDGDGEGDSAEKQEEMAKSWSSYLPSIGGKAGGSSSESNMNSQSKGWSSYIPTGVGYSSYMPSKSTLSAIESMHARDPTKSYAEQLYDFSKTPVGAAGISVATGSGYAGSLYAGYKAYATVSRDSSQPGMEFLSMPHTRASLSRLTPKVNDTLVSNLRAPMLTIVEDTSPGVHDTLVAACDPQRYRELGVEKWEEHGSCAENLVMALQLLNEASGLKGAKAIGSDVTVNSVPAPLNLFMNIPWTQEGEISFEAPTGKRGDYIKMRAERDVVVVMSACPQDILEINGKKPMVAHFVVESPSPEDEKKAQEQEAEAKKVIEKAQQRKKGTPRKLDRAESQGGSGSPAPAPATPKKADAGEKAEDTTPAKSARKAPKKLEKRGSLAPGSPAPGAKA
ncbi:hypothetical protein EJ08DRAFT_288127 [Tothia fuscella]|uniref:DUF1989 domain-containing protein n=1 Tax=Tothia fuscella TaxID=1048955 RepID=A0A9P4P2K6_9PEZI|nr:hypothetical protein EJ08DRAFT_288127 [Tothia fuscella]